jgi:HD-GYP domain-containing protein (c-di-GMP phosphodiesterase class II)
MSDPEKKENPDSDISSSPPEEITIEEALFELARLRAMNDVSRALAGTLDLDRLLNLIVAKTTEIMNADRSSLFLIDWDTEELWSKVAQGVRFMEIRFPMHMGLAGAVAKSGEILNIPDAYEDKRFNQEFDKRTGYRTRSVLAVPMNNHAGDRIGVMQVLNKRGDEAFTHDDEEILKSLAGQAAIAVENSQLYEEQKKSFISFVETLATAMDARDPITAGHSKRVTDYSVAIAEKLDYSEKQLEILNAAALMHDIGKIGVPEIILFKDGKLDDEEYQVIQSHARHTLNILEKIHFDREKKEIPMMAGSHHEKIDGTGYPLGLAGDDIPEEGRVLAIGDIFDAITSRRHYRDRMEFIRVMKILDEESQGHIQPEFLEAFKSLTIAQIMIIMEQDNVEPVEDEDLEIFEKYSLGELQKIMEVKEGEGEIPKDEEYLLERFAFYYHRSISEGWVPD